MSDVVRLVCETEKSATLEMKRVGPGGESEAALLFFESGELVHAQAEGHQGKPAFYRVLGWETGDFSIVFQDIAGERTIERELNKLFLDGFLLVKAKVAWSAGLSSFESVLSVDVAKLTSSLGELPDSANAILRVVNGDKTIAELSKEVELADSEFIGLVDALLKSGVLLVEVSKKPSRRTRAETTPVFGKRRRGNTAKNFPSPPRPDSSNDELASEENTEAEAANRIEVETLPEGEAEDGARVRRATPAWTGGVLGEQGEERSSEVTDAGRLAPVIRLRTSTSRAPMADTLPPPVAPVPAAANFDSFGGVSSGGAARAALTGETSGEELADHPVDESSGRKVLPSHSALMEMEEVLANVSSEKEVEEAPLALIARANDPSVDRPLLDDVVSGDTTVRKTGKSRYWPLATAAAVLLAAGLGLTALAVPNPQPTEVGQVEKAMANGELSRALRLLDGVGEDSSKSLSLRVELLYQLGEQDAALEAAEGLLESYPAASRGWLTKGLIYFERGQKLRAAAALRRYLVLKPEAPNSSDVRALLKTLE